MAVVSPYCEKLG